MRVKVEINNGEEALEVETTDQLKVHFKNKILRTKQSFYYFPKNF